ncbi:MAG: ANTAR domain-containing protein [Candidatus Aenigmatarchaeota archaeon]
MGSKKISSNKEIEILKKINYIIGYTPSLDELLEKIIDIIIDITKGDSCFIYLLDDKKEELILRASKNPHPKIIGKIKLKIGEGITGWVAKEKKVVAIEENASEDERFKFFHNLPEDRYEAFLSIPMINKGDVIGVINVQNKKKHKYKNSEIIILSTVAQYLAGIIENTKLMEEIIKAKEELSARKIIERAKGILMKEKNIDEETAYKILRKKSMDTRREMKEIAEAIIIAREI